MRKILKAILLRFILAVLAVSLCACSAGSGAASAENKAMRVFTDSAGRQVEVPVDIETVAPSGTYAQIMLYTLCPDKLAGISTAFSRSQKEYVDEKYQKLPALGQLYGGSGTLNLETLISAEPDVVIDIGQAKEGIEEDMDAIASQSGIPTVFIEADFANMAEAYDMLGELLGEEQKAGELSGYIRDVFSMAEANNAELSDEEKLRVIYSQGEYGLEVNGAGSIHAEVIDAAGAVNAAQLDSSLIPAKGGTEVSIEQVLSWQPDVLLLSPDANYDDIFTDPVWADVTAVQEGRVYEVPSALYNWLDRPPSVQRVLGVLWLGNLLYPDLYDYDMAEKACEFYKLFFGYDMTEDEAKEIMANSTYRQAQP